MKGITRSKRPSLPDEKLSHWKLRLYTAGHTPRSIAAFENLKKICEDYLKGRFHIEVIDLLKRPQLAQANQIVAIPTLVRTLPLPIRKVIGDLSNTARALMELDLPPASRKELINGA